jgi:serine/threonine protein kinase
LEEIVGEGSYGQVIKGKCKKSSRDVAIKFIQNVCESDYDCVKVIREIQLLRRLTEVPNNVHTVELIDLLICPKESNNSLLGLFIVMEYIDSDLKHVMSAAPSMDDFTLYHTL